MFKIFLQRLSLLAICGLFALSLAASLQPALARAAGPTVTIAQPGATSSILIGHPGTKVTLTGTGFKPNGTAKLFATPVSDPNQCKPNQVTDNMKAFVPDSTTIGADGSFNVVTNWPDAANIPSAPYYLCVTTQDEQAISSNNFTVAEPVAIKVTPKNAAPGDKITVQGTGWLPVQNIKVSIVSNGSPITSQVVQSAGPDGIFTTTLTVPQGTQDGSYQVSVTAPNEDSNYMKANQALTVAAEPTAAPSTPTPTPGNTPTATTTPTANSSGSGGSNGLMIFTFLLGGVGIVLVVVGAIMYFSYTRQ